MLTLKATADERQFSITICDNGKGFELNPGNDSGHYGLMNMRERARESYIELKIQSSYGKGTSVILTVFV